MAGKPTWLSMAGLWPKSVPRIPDEAWTREPVADLARKYDSVEAHGWYDNLEPTVDQVLETVEPGDIVLDYSGGTGILVDRLFEREPDVEVGLLLVDSSPKFLRLALDKLGADERVAFRRLDYLSEEGRLERVDEALDRALIDRGIDVVTSTNAIHLYHDLEATLASWRSVMAPGARAFVQSGNVDRPGRPDDVWVIDRTVAAIAEQARHLVKEDDRFAAYRDRLDDDTWLTDHEAYRSKVFPTIRASSYYEATFEAAGFEALDVERRSIEARVDEWVAFLSAYADAVVGWVGGAEKVTGKPASPQAVDDRRELLEAAARDVFEADTFQAEWTYWTLAP